VGKSLKIKSIIKNYNVQFINDFNKEIINQYNSGNFIIVDEYIYENNLKLLKIDKKKIIVINANEKTKEYSRAADNKLRFSWEKIMRPH